jgi:type IV pilus assembly protein PilM
MVLRKRILLPIGIHLNLESVQMVQLEQADGSVALVSKAGATFPPIAAPSKDGEATGVERDEVSEVAAARYREGREFVRQKLTGNGFRGKEAVISLPAEHLVIRQVRMAPMQPDELIAALAWELQGKLPFDPKRAVIRHIVAGTVSEDNETKQDVIALAVRRDVVEKHVAATEKLGLHVVGVGVEPCVMGYPYVFAVTHGADTPGGPCGLMLVHLGALTTYVTIIRGQETAFVKGIDFGVENVVQAVAKSQDIPTEEARAMHDRWCGSSTGTAETEGPDPAQVYNRIRPALEHFTDQIESCMRYHGSLARGADIDRLIFLGPGARDRPLVGVLGARLGIACEVGDPLGAFAERGNSGEAEPELAVALGLSLFEAQ